MERTAISAMSDLFVGGMRLPERAILCERDHAAQHRIVFLEPRDVHLRQLHRRDFPPSNELGQLGHRQERELVDVRRHRTVRNLAAHHRPARFRLNFLPRRQRIENDRRTHGVVEWDFVKRFDPLLLLLQAVEHELALGLVEVHTGHFLGAGNGFDGDVGTGGEPGPENAGEKSG